MPGLGQVEVDDGAEQRVGHLKQHAGATGADEFAGDGAAVVEILQGGLALGHDVVAGLTAQLGDEGHTAGVVLERGVVQAFRWPSGHGG